MSTAENQYVLEDLFDKNQAFKRLDELYRQPFITDHMKANDFPIEFGIEMLIQIGLHKRAELKTMVGLLWKHFGHKPEQLQLCAKMLERAVELQLILYSQETGEFVVFVDIPADVQQDIDRFQYPLPMVVPPLKLQDNASSAYLRGKGSVILKGYNHHNDDVCIEHLDRCNRVELKLNMETAEMIKNKWKGLDKQKKDETWEDYQKRLKAFRKYDKHSRAVMDLMVKGGDRLWMTHRYDKRGRTYAQGYHINPQGSDWNKAVVEFANEEIVDG